LVFGSIFKKEKHFSKDIAAPDEKRLRVLI